MASLRLKLGGEVEAPTRVTLSAWPNPELPDPAAKGPGTLWNVPLFSMKKLKPADSAAVLYWHEKPLAPEAKREVGFSYGLGNFAASKDGTLGLIVGGELHEGGTAAVVALVVRPTKGQQVTLHVSEGLGIVGKPAQAVALPPSGADNPIAVVTWKVRAKRKGLLNFRVVSSAGALVGQDVRILPAPPRPVDVAALAKADLEKLQGNWYVVSSRGDGKKPALDAVQKLVVVGQTLTIHYDPKLKGGTETCFLKIAPLANPKKIDIFPPLPGYQQPGILRWQGDRLELCLGGRLKVVEDGKVIANAESVRPRAFDAKGATLLLLSRTKPGAKEKKDDPVYVSRNAVSNDFSTALLQLRRLLEIITLFKTGWHREHPPACAVFSFVGRWAARSSQSWPSRLSWSPSRVPIAALTKPASAAPDKCRRLSTGTRKPRFR